MAQILIMQNIYRTFLGFHKSPRLNKLYPKKTRIIRERINCAEILTSRNITWKIHITILQVLIVYHVYFCLDQTGDWGDIQRVAHSHGGQKSYLQRIDLKKQHIEFRTELKIIIYYSFFKMSCTATWLLPCFVIVIIFMLPLSWL